MEETMKFGPLDVDLVLGSESDAPHGNVVIDVFKKVGVRYEVRIASCHRDAGQDFIEFLEALRAPIIAYLGGMEFAAPGIAESTNRNLGILDKLVYAIPTDIAARSAIENLPMGTGIATSGLNEKLFKHSMINSALTIAKIAGMLGNRDIFHGLAKYYADLRKDKPLVSKVQLTGDGFIPV
jgi:phosphoribosylcarboxyaminoimidazole (NCAIR) mutase